MPLGITIPKNAFATGREQYKKNAFPDSVELPPGKFICQIQEGKALDLPKGPSIVFSLLVMGDNDYVGKQISIFFGLSEERIAWLFKLFAVLGYEEMIEELNEESLEAILNDIGTNKPMVRVKASRKNDMTNYRVEQLVTEPGAEPTESAADTDALGGKAGIKPGVLPESEEIAPEPAKAPVATKVPTPPPKPISPPAPAKTGSVMPQVAKPVATPAQASATALAPKPVAKAAPATAKPVAKEPDPAPVVTDEEVIEEPTTELTIGSKVTVNLSSGQHVIKVTALHPQEADKDGNLVDKLTGRSETDGKIYKFPVSKIAD
jgi:hypothetical protein